MKKALNKDSKRYRASSWSREKLGIVPYGKNKLYFIVQRCTVVVV